MKIFTILLLFSSFTLFAQINPRLYEGTERTVIMIGYGQGGGSIMGVDFERLVADNIGVQAGVGFLGFDLGVNYHISPKIRAPYISLQYWYNGLSHAYLYQSIGPFVGVRLFDFLNLSVGMPIILDTGSNATDKIEESNVLFRASVGAFFKF